MYVYNVTLLYIYIVSCMTVYLIVGTEFDTFLKLARL